MIEILRPNAPGDETELGWSWVEGGYPGGGSRDPDKNFQMVDEIVADEVVTFVRTASTSYKRDLYNLPASTGNGTINKITLYFRCADYEASAVARVKGAIKSDSMITETTEQAPHTDFGERVWGTYSQEWETNPTDGEAWEWADIDALQIGIAMKHLVGNAYAMCTQVYVEVDYTPEVAPVGCLPVVGAGILLAAGIIAGIIALV